jgi:cation transport regulator ChaC
MIDQPKADNLPYFAYGSNLNLADLDRWCRQRNAEAGFLAFWQTAWLLDHAVRFSLHSTTRRGGVLDIGEGIGQRVPGVLFHVAGPVGWDLLDQKEGVPVRYQRESITVTTEQGDRCSALTYRVSPQCQSGFVTPSDFYVNVVCEGLSRWGLPDEHILAAAGRPLR